MNDKNFDSFIKSHYPHNISNLQMSERAMDCIVQLNKNSAFTKVSKRIRIVYILVLLTLIFGLPVSAYATAKLYFVVHEKVQKTHMSKEKIVDLANELEKQEYSSKDIEILDSLHVNEAGQTYGPDCLGADLVQVEADNGKIGYVYRDELEENTVAVPEEAINSSNESVRLKVYESDGITVIGYFTLGESMNSNQ